MRLKLCKSSLNCGLWINQILFIGRQFTCKVKRHERVLPFQNANIWQVKIIKIITTLIWLQTLHYVLRIFPRFTCKSEKVLSHHVISVSDHTARGCFEYERSEACWGILLRIINIAKCQVQGLNTMEWWKKWQSLLTGAGHKKHCELKYQTMYVLIADNPPVCTRD